MSYTKKTVYISRGRIVADMLKVAKSKGEEGATQTELMDKEKKN